MASPLSFFRKYQKVMLVFFGVALMAIFLIGPFFDQMNSFGVTKNATQNTVMAEWKGGKVTRSDLNMLRFRHYRTVEFLNAVQQLARKKNEANLPLAQMISPLLSEGSSETEEEYDMAVMERFLRAERAKEEGVVISDTMVDGYIMMLAGNADITPTELELLNRKVNMGEMELPQIREHIKLELAAQTYSVMSTLGLNSSLVPTPTEALQLFEKTSRRIECEVFPVAVKDYLDKVTGQPSDAELRKLFEEGRFELPDITHARPGFKLPKRANVEYFVGDLEAFLVNEMNKLTDKEVQEEYDRLVAAKDPLVFEDLNLDPNSGLPPSDPAGGSAPATPPAEATSGNDKGAAAEATTPPANAGGEQNAEAKQQEANKTEEKGGGESGGGQSGSGGGGLPLASAAGEQSFDEDLANQPLESFVDLPTVPTSLNSEFANQEEGKQEEGKQEEGNKEEGKKEGQEAGGEAKQETAQENVQGKTQENAATATQTPPVAADQDVPPVAPPGDQNPVNPPERKVKPLKDVADQIKRRLKTPVATEMMNRAIEKAQEVVQDYQAEVSEWEVDPELQRQPKPTPPDFEKIAKENGLAFKSTGLLDMSQMADSDFGKVMVFFRDLGQVFTHMQLVFGQFQQLQPYNPIATNELLASKYYLFWVKEKEDSKPVEFAAARDSVIQYWKYQKALEMAKAEAQKVADNANQSGKSLTELYGDKAANTGEFSWFSIGMGGGFDYGTPVGVTAAADEFMQTAFALEVGKAGVGADELNEKVYAIRLVRNDNRDAEALAQEFYDRVAKDQAFPQEMFQAGQTYLRDTFVDWQRQFHKEMGLQWVGR